MADHDYSEELLGTPFMQDSSTLRDVPVALYDQVMEPEPVFHDGQEYLNLERIFAIETTLSENWALTMDEKRGFGGSLCG